MSTMHGGVVGRVDVEMRVLEVVKELDGPTFSAVNHNSLSLVQ